MSDDLHDVPIGPEIDLHAFAPRDIPSVVEEYVRAAHALGLRVLRIVHGRGRGVQRAVVHRALSEHPLVSGIRDDPHSHLGATVCTLVD